MNSHSQTFVFFANLTLCFLLSDITVFICHVRNPYMRFLSSITSYVLLALSALSLLITLVLFFRNRVHGQDSDSSHSSLFKR